MPVSPIWIALLGQIIGTVAIPVIVAVVLDRRLEEKRMQIQYQIRRLDQEWEAARAQSQKESQRP